MKSKKYMYRILRRDFTGNWCIAGYALSIYDVIAFLVSMRRSSRNMDFKILRHKFDSCGLSAPVMFDDVTEICFRASAKIHE